MSEITTYLRPAAVNANLNLPAVVDSNTLPWLASPQPGVERRMLDRIGAEVARATSIVRYAPNSQFPQHIHGGGEEFFVLEGTFSDENGDYPVSTYVRNPPGSAHAPFTKSGCTIFVKLRQMKANGEPHVVVDAHSVQWQVERSGFFIKELFNDGPGGERVLLLHLAPGTQVSDYTCSGGEEILVLKGTLVDGTGEHPTGSWIRNPPGHNQKLLSTTGCELWVKRGHLKNE